MAGWQWHSAEPAVPDCSLTAVRQVEDVTAAGLAVTVTATRLVSVRVTDVTVAVRQLVTGRAPGTMQWREEDKETN